MKHIIIFLALFISAACYSQQKLALVMGNADYESSPLRNPVNDANDMANTLTDLGFKVTLSTNLNRMQMEDVIRQYSKTINNDDVALFYFSGHGVQVQGLNYLVPVGETITTETDIRYKCVEAGFVMDYIERGNGSMNIIILDACRDNPFTGFRSVSRGFAYMSAPTGTFISYSTAPGSVAMDGDGENSPYTSVLIEKMQVPGMKLEEVFKSVRQDVMAATGEQQIPWESSSIVGDFYFKSGEFKPEEITLYKQEEDAINKKDEPVTHNKQEEVVHDDLSGRTGNFTDPRDGKRYNWVQIGNQVWMAENLNHKMRGTRCYKYKKSKCEEYGRLYKWKTAVGSCPVGWHLPSETEWVTLINYLGGNSIAGKKLKSTAGWTEGNGNNISGFNALPGGYCTPVFCGKCKISAHFWSSTISGNKAWRLQLQLDDQTYSGTYTEVSEFSVRCVKD